MTHKGIITKALIVSLIYGAICAVLTSMLTASHTTTMADGRTLQDIRGLSAVKYIIDQIGLSQYIVHLLPVCLLFVILIFVGCILQSYWLKKSIK